MSEREKVKAACGCPRCRANQVIRSMETLQRMLVHPPPESPERGDHVEGKIGLKCPHCDQQTVNNPCGHCGKWYATPEPQEAESGEEHHTAVYDGCGHRYRAEDTGWAGVTAGLCPFCRTPEPTRPEEYYRATQAMQDDVAEMLRALGISDHARPISCHRVIQDEILPAIRRLREKEGGERIALIPPGSEQEVGMHLQIAEKIVRKCARDTGSIRGRRLHGVAETLATLARSIRHRLRSRPTEGGEDGG